MGNRVEVPTDAQLVVRSAAGDERAFEALIERHFNSVYYAAYSRLASREAAEDLTQEVFLRAYLHLATLKQPGQFGGWVCRVARNLAEDWRRHQRTVSRLIPLVAMEEEVVEAIPDNKGESVRDKLYREQQAEAVIRAIEKLPDEQREILLLHFVEGLNDRQIAERVGVHRTTIRYHLRHTVAQFREGLVPWLEHSVAHIRPKPAAVARTTAIVAATAAMSAGAKSSLAASAGIPAAAAIAPAATGTAAATNTQLSLLQTIKATTIGGVIGMAKVKVIMTAGALIAGAFIGREVYQSGAMASMWGKEVRVMITQAAPGTKPNEERLGDDAIRLSGVSTEVLLKAIGSATGNRIVTEGELPPGPFNVELHGIHFNKDGPYPYERTVKAVSEAYKKTFGLTMAPGKQTSTVLVMRAPNGRSAGLKDGESDNRIIQTGGRYLARNGSISSIGETIERATGYIVIDETGLNGKYSFDLKWHSSKPASIFASLRNQLGLEVKQEKREIPVTVVRKAVQ
ncbi:MAG: TIGR03435 family protein [Candidatus Sumerlaeaceae bacterium]